MLHTNDPGKELVIDSKDAADRWGVALRVDPETGRHVVEIDFGELDRQRAETLGIGSLRVVLREFGLTPESDVAVKLLALDGRLEIWRDIRTLIFDGERMSLPPLIFALFIYFIEHGGEVASNNEIIKAVWGQRLPDDPEYALRGAILRLRKLLGKLIDPSASRPDGLIYNESGQGYGINQRYAPPHRQKTHK